MGLLALACMAQHAHRRTGAPNAVFRPRGDVVWFRAALSALALVAAPAFFAMAPAPAAANDAPQYLWGNVDGAVVEMTFDKQLEGVHKPRAGAFTVKVDGEAVALLASNPVGILATRNAYNGDVWWAGIVRLTLGTNVASDQAVTVSYSAELAGDDALQTVEGFKVASFADRSLPNNAQNAASPKFKIAAVDGTQLTVRFDEDLRSTSVPATSAFTVTVGGAARAVDNVSVAGEAVTLTLASAVARSDTVTVRYTRPADSPLTDAEGNAVATFGEVTAKNNSPPAFVSAVVDRAQLTATFDGDLASTSVPAASAFAVTVGGAARAVNNVAIGGAAVTLTLASAVAHGDTVTVRYTRPAGSPLMTGGGKPVATFGEKTVENNTPPAFASAVVDGTQLKVTFDGDLRSTSAPAASAFAVTVGGAARAVDNVAVKGAAVTLTLASAALSGDTVTVRYTRPTSNPLTYSSGDPVATFGETTAENISGPAKFNSAFVNGTEVSVGFNKALDIDTNTTARAFTMSVNGVVHTAIRINKFGSYFYGMQFGWSVAHGDEVTLSYDNTVGISLKDLSGQPVASFSAKPVTNETPANAPPVLQSAAVDAAALTLTFNAALDAASVPAASAFTVTVGGSTVSLATSAPVRVSGATATLTLGSAALRGDAVTVGYTPPGSNPLRGGNGIGVAAFSVGAANNSPPPAFVSAKVDRSKLTLTFEEFMLSTSVPATSAFAVTVGGAARAVTEVSVSRFREVTLTLASAVAAGDTVTVRYTRPAANPLTYASGDPVATFGETTAENISGPPVFKSAFVNGALLTVVFSKELKLELFDPTTFSMSVNGVDHVASSIKGLGQTHGFVRLNFGWTVAHGDEVTVSYDSKGNKAGIPLQDLVGQHLESFSAEPVTNETPENAPPVLQSAAVDTAALTLTFNAALDAASVPAASAFTVTVGGSTVSLAASAPVRVSGATATLTLASAVAQGDAVTVGYTPPGSNPLRGSNAIDVKAFGGRTVTNSTPANRAPAFPADAAERSVAENHEDAAAVGEPVTATDADGDTLSYSLSSEGTDHESFTIDGAGQIRVASGTTLVRDAQASYRVNVRVSDGKDSEGDAETTPAIDDTIAVTINVTGVAEAPALTAAFVGVPAEHDKRAFSFELRFSEDFPGRLRYKLLRDEAFQVTNGRLRSAKRVAQGQNQRWTITVKPTSFEDVTVTLPAATDCTAPGSVCTDAGRMLSATVSVQVTGPALLTAGDAEVREGADEAMAFEVRLSRAASGTVTVDYATVDGTAKAGRDYTATRGTLTFAPGEVAKTVSVPVLDDSRNEERESFALVLSNESGARIADRDAVGAIVNREVEPPPLAASFVGVPAEHDMRAFSFELRFSENFPGRLRHKVLRDEAFQVTNGRVRSAKRVAPGQNQRWTITVKPDSFEDVVVTLPAGSVRTEAGRQLANAVTARVLGPALLSVADAEASEGPDAEMAFEVTLSRAASGAVTVDYATANGTAKAGEDYTATSGTLTFAAGETEKTVTVALLDDALDEGRETFSLRLTNATGARIEDGEAVGTIVNSDPLQRMWLSRFGRTVAGHLTEAVSDRLAGPLTGAQVTVGGQRVDLARAQDKAWLGQTLTSFARALGASEGQAPEGTPGSGSGAGGWPGTGPGRLESPAAGSAPMRAMSGRALLLGSAFHLAREGDGGGPGLAAWGRVTAGGFDGEAPADGGTVRIDGDVTTGILGADAEWNHLLAGVAVSLSEGEGTLFDQSGAGSDTIESTMTTVSPYARVSVSEGVSVWGLAGFGTGDMTIVQAANATTGRKEQTHRTDLAMRLAAVGGQGALMQADDSGGIDLALKADAFTVETEWDPVSNERKTTADASRLRLALEGSRAFHGGGGGVLTPGLELGLRHDAGDAETGAGVELGGRISYADPASGLSVEAKARMLVAHADSDYEEWGVSGVVRLAPGARGRGLSFSLSPTVGATSSAAERLWGARDAGGLAPAGAGFEASRGLDAGLGYGLALFGDRFTGTPNVGLGVSDTARDYRIGWRLTPAVPNGSGFELNLDATRREAANGDAPAVHGVLLRGAVRW